MEDKRYDPYTGYEIKDEDSTQEYHLVYDILVLDLHL